MAVLVIASKERAAAIRDSFGLGGQKRMGTLPTIDARTLAGVLPKLQAQEWETVVFDLDDVARCRVEGLSDILKQYMTALGDPVKFVVVDAAGRLGRSEGARKRAQIVADLAEARGTALVPPAEDDDILLVFDDDDDAEPAAPSPAPVTADDIFSQFPGMETVPGPAAPAPADEFEAIFGTPPAGEAPAPSVPAAPAAPEAAPAPVEDELTQLFDSFPQPVPADAAHAAPPDFGIEAMLTGQDDPLADIFGSLPATGSAPSAPPAAPVSPVAPVPQPGPAAPAFDIGSLVSPAPSGNVPDLDHLSSLLEASRSRHPVPDGGEIQAAGDSERKSGFGKMLKSLVSGEVVNNHVLYSLDPAVIPPKLQKTYFITCWAPKGGTGKTTGAVAIGHYLAWGLGDEYRRTKDATKRPRVLLVDLDEFADAHMQSETLRSKYGFDGISVLPNVKDLYDNLGSITNDWSSLSPYLVADEASGLFMLMPQRNTPDTFDISLDDAAYTKIIDKIYRFFDFIIFDCGPHLMSAMNGLAPFALARANVVVLMGDQAFPTIIHTVKYFAQIMKRSPLLFSIRDNYIYVVNKYRPRARSSLSEIKETMGQFVSEVIEIPDDGDAGLQSADEGTNILFSNNRDIKMAYKRLVEAILRRIKVLSGDCVTK